MWQDATWQYTQLTAAKTPENLPPQRPAGDKKVAGRTDHTREGMMSDGSWLRRNIAVERRTSGSRRPAAPDRGRLIPQGA
jgi:hypothetical protein